MTKYIKKNNDGTFDKTIINFFIKEKSIAKTVFKMNHDHGVIISRAEIINLLKNTDNGHLIKKRTNKKKNDQFKYSIGQGRSTSLDIQESTINHLPLVR